MELTRTHRSHCNSWDRLGDVRGLKSAGLSFSLSLPLLRTQVVAHYSQRQKSTAAMCEVLKPSRLRPAQQFHQQAASTDNECEFIVSVVGLGIEALCFSPNNNQDHYQDFKRAPECCKPRCRCSKPEAGDGLEKLENPTDRLRTGSDDH